MTVVIVSLISACIGLLALMLLCATIDRLVAQEWREALALCGTFVACCAAAIMLMPLL